MQPDMVAMGSPFLNGVAGVKQIAEPILIETLVTELIEAFEERVLRRLARLYEVQLHTEISRPEKQCLAGNPDHCLRQSSWV